jgi:hypothetical protein
MSVYQINPLEDTRWGALTETHPRASIFHTSAWLRSLQQTYGYEPVALTTCAPGAELRNAIVFCRVKSWLTGERLVSVPFADHCDPLFDRLEDFYSILEAAAGGIAGSSCKHVEIRPLDSDALGLSQREDYHPGKIFRIHLLDLKPKLEDLLRSFDKSSVQRRIRRVEKEALKYEEGDSPELLKKFYSLQVQTRRRHQVPPQPMTWFSNVLAALGAKAKIRMVSKDETPIASILTLAHGESLVYKYGCSDARFNNLGGMVSLFWRTIQDAKAAGVKTFDFGRSDLDNPGLLNFKSNWGTANLPLTYWRCPRAAKREDSVPSGSRRMGGYIVSRLPDPLLILLGRTLYKHVG